MDLPSLDSDGRNGSVSMRQQGGWSQKEKQIIIVSDAVRGSKVDLDGNGLQEKQNGKDSEKVETAKRS